MDIARGLLSQYRAKAARAVNHRWSTADALVGEYLHGRVIGRGPQRALYHQDECVAAAVRVGMITSHWTVAPEPDEVRESDLPYLTAIDLGHDDINVRTRHTLECMILGMASDEDIAQHLGYDPEHVQIYHDLFFDIRDRLDRPMQITDMLFAPAFMQGGCRNPQETERIIAFLCGHEMFIHYRLGTTDNSWAEIVPKLFDGLNRNQSLSALLRRSTGFESTNQVIEHLHQTLLLEQKAQGGGESEAVVALRNGFTSIAERVGGLRVASEQDIAQGGVENVHATESAVQKLEESNA